MDLIDRREGDVTVDSVTPPRLVRRLSVSGIPLLLLVLTLVLSVVVIHSSSSNLARKSLTVPTAIENDADDTEARSFWTWNTSDPTARCDRSVLTVWGDPDETTKASWAWPKPAINGMRCGSGARLALCCKPKKTILILIWTGRPWSIPFMPPGKKATLPFICCNGIQVSYTADRRQLARADIVEFHFVEYGSELPGRAGKDQLWMLFNMEGQYRLLPTLPLQFNLLRSFRKNSDVVNTYAATDGCQCNRTLGTLTHPFGLRKSTPLAAVVSNCHSHAGREGVLRALINSVETHSFGRCMHNHKIPQPDGDWKNRVNKLLSWYKFAFAVENALCTDYVTEKFFRLFRLGIVPVVVSLRGKPGYDRLSPTTSSYLDVSRFPDIAAVADEIHKAASSRGHYMKYHAYRGPNPEERVSDEYLERMCTKADDGWDRSWCELAETLSTAEGRRKLAKRRRNDFRPTRECLRRGRLRQVYP